MQIVLQVGKNESGCVFILVGTSRIEYTGIATFSSEELKALTVSETNNMLTIMCCICLTKGGQGAIGYK